MWLPGLADPERMQRVASVHASSLGLPDGIVRMELVDVRLTHPHRAESPLCRGWATYRVILREGESQLLYVKGFPDGATAEAAWREDRGNRPTGHRSLLVHDDLVVWRFPEDPLLPALPLLVSSSLRPDLIPPAVRSLLELSDDEQPTVTVVRYQPEASATLRYEGRLGGGAAAFAKHLAGEGVLEHAARHEALWSLTAPGRPLRVAEPLAADPRWGVLWTRGVPGVPLTEAVVPVDLPHVAKTVGSLLAALHASSVSTSRTVTVDALVDEMRKKAGKLTAADAAVAPCVARLVRSVERRLRDVEPPRACSLHGDFHLDQLVSSDEGPVLVDLDSMVRGSPEVDLGEFLVDLALRGLPTSVTGQVADSLLVSYEAAAAHRVDPALLSVCADAEFVNRCYRHLRRHTPGWRDALRAELARRAEVTSLLTHRPLPHRQARRGG